MLGDFFPTHRYRASRGKEMPAQHRQDKYNPVEVELSSKVFKGEKRCLSAPRPIVEESSVVDKLAKEAPVSIFTRVFGVYVWYMYQIDNRASAPGYAKAVNRTYARILGCLRRKSDQVWSQRCSYSSEFVASRIPDGFHQLTIAQSRFRTRFVVF